MRLLLDTHVVLWAAADPGRLPERVAAAIRDGDNEVLVSAATTWEVAIKRGLGRLTFPAAVTDVIAELRLTPLDITHEHAQHVEQLTDHHADPFDRILVAQAQVEEAVLATGDDHIRSYDVNTIWA